MSTPDAGDGTDPQKTQTELEMEAGRKAIERRTAQRAVPLKKTNGAAPAVLAAARLPGGGLTEAVPSGLLDASNAAEPAPAPPPETVAIDRASNGPSDDTAAPIGFPQAPAVTLATAGEQRAEQPAANGGQAGGGGTRPPLMRGPEASGAAAFMERVVAWPGPRPGYINLHYPSNNPKLKSMPGKPFTNVNDFMNYVDFAVRTFDAVYFCLSTQSQTQTYKNGKLGAVRRTENAIALKSIWLDVDVKNDPKNYKSLSEALNALTKFTQAAYCCRVEAVRRRASTKGGGSGHSLQRAVRLPKLLTSFAAWRWPSLSQSQREVGSCSIKLSAHKRRTPIKRRSATRALTGAPWRNCFALRCKPSGSSAWQSQLRPRTNSRITTLIASNSNADPLGLPFGSWMGKRSLRTCHLRRESRSMLAGRCA
jgi:hypothetical protein